MHIGRTSSLKDIPSPYSLARKTRFISSIISCNPLGSGSCGGFFFFGSAGGFGTVIFLAIGAGTIFFTTTWACGHRVNITAINRHR